MKQPKTESSKRDFRVEATAYFNQLKKMTSRSTRKIIITDENMGI